jgi:hypothetical protein
MKKPSRAPVQRKRKEYKIFVSGSSKYDGPTMKEILEKIRAIVGIDSDDQLKIWSEKKRVALTLAGIVTAKRKSTQGALIKSTTVV